jgi:hypothetical protein
MYMSNMTVKPGGFGACLPGEGALRFSEGENVLTEENLFITIEPDNKEPL